MLSVVLLGSFTVISTNSEPYRPDMNEDVSQELNVSLKEHVRNSRKQDLVKAVGYGSTCVVSGIVVFEILRRFYTAYKEPTPLDDLRVCYEESRKIAIEINASEDEINKQPTTEEWRNKAKLTGFVYLGNVGYLAVSGYILYLNLKHETLQNGFKYFRKALS